MSPDEVKAAYQRALDIAGETVIIRQYTGTGTSRPRFDAEVRARVVDFNPDELVGTIVQGDRKLIILADDLAAAQMQRPLAVGDEVVVRGKKLRIESMDDSTRRIQGVLIAYELAARGN